MKRSSEEKSSKKSFFKRILGWIWFGVKWFLITSVLGVILFKWVPVPFTFLMLQRGVTYTIEGKGFLMQKEWIPYSEISPNMPLAVVSSEDQKFPTHFGFDLDAINKAFSENQKNKRLKGGSTISQQTAKNVFLFPSRTWVRKGLETYFTFLIELFWSKQRIMEVYLNVVEFGVGVYGIESASQYYFNKPAKKLNKSQSAMIAAILPAPRKWNPKKPTRKLLKRQAWVMRQMNNLGNLDLK